MTKFLVVVPHENGTCAVRVETDPDRRLSGPFESWAIVTGKQVVFVHQTLGRTLEPLRLPGQFMQGEARYGVAYDEMLLLLKHHMGPTDRERYETAARHKSLDTWYVALWVLVGASSLAFTVAAGMLKFALAIVVLPLLLGVVPRRQ